MGYSWQVGMGTIFWGAMGLLILTLLRVRYWLIANIPLTLRVGITAGIGLLIALLGLHNAGIVVASPATMVTVGNLTSPALPAGAARFLPDLHLLRPRRPLRGADRHRGDHHPGLAVWRRHLQGLRLHAPSIEPVFGQLDLMGSLDISLAGIIFSFMLVNLFDSSGTLIGVTNRAKLADDKGHFRA